MRNSILFILTVTLLTSCKEDKKTFEANENVTIDTLDAAETTVETPDSLKIQTMCYYAATGKDSVFASLTDNLGTITGKIKFQNFEKDSSAGDLFGIKNGDTLKLTYRFESEGVTTENEMWFLQKDDRLYEGIGERDTDGEKYKSYKNIKFDGWQLIPAECAKIDKKL